MQKEENGQEKRKICYKINYGVASYRKEYWHDGVVVGVSALQSVDLGFISLVESYQKTLKNGIHSFSAWRSAHKGQCGEQASKLACCVLVQGT